MARSENMRPGLIQLLEQSSVYAHRTSAPHPEIYCYRTVVLTGTTYRILSVIREAGLDFTGRTNFLAHHLVFEPGEPFGINSPAEILLFWDGWKSVWEGEPQSLTPVSIPSLMTLEPPAKNWSLLLGNAALAASPYTFSAGCWWISNCLAETQILTLMGESLRLGSSPEDLWTRSFSTYLGQILDPQQYNWKGWNGYDPRTHPAGNQKAELYLDNPQSLPEGPAKEKDIAQNGTLPTVSAGTTGTKTSGYKKIGLKELPKKNTQEEFISSSLPTVQGQSRAVSREAFPFNHTSEKKNYRRLGIIAIVIMAALSFSGACLYYRKAEEKNKITKESEFWCKVRDGIKTKEYPFPYEEEQKKVIQILKYEQPTAQSSQKLKVLTDQMYEQKPYLHELNDIAAEYELFVRAEMDKVADEKKKLDDQKSIELRKPDDEISREKMTQPLQKETPREQNETKALKSLSAEQPSPRQYLVNEIIKDITGNLSAPCIQDDVTINVIIGNGDTADNFKEVEVLNTKGKTRKTKEELRDFSLLGKTSEPLEFGSLPTNNCVWLGINKDNKTNCLILIMPQTVFLNISGENAARLGAITDEACKIIGDTTKILIGSVSYKQNEIGQGSAEQILKLHIQKAQKEITGEITKTSNNILELCQKNPARFDQSKVIEEVQADIIEDATSINNFALGWLKDPKPEDLIPSNNRPWRTNNNSFEIGKLKNNGTADTLKKAFPEKYNDTNQYTFSDYRASARELINRKRAEYFLVPIMSELDQISVKEYEEKYKITEDDRKTAEAIRSLKRRSEEEKSRYKVEEQRKNLEIQIWSKRSDGSPAFQLNVKGD